MAESVSGGNSFPVGIRSAFSQSPSINTPRFSLLNDLLTQKPSPSSSIPSLKSFHTSRVHNDLSPSPSGIKITQVMNFLILRDIGISRKQAIGLSSKVLSSSKAMVESLPKKFKNKFQLISENSKFKAYEESNDERRYKRFSQDIQKLIIKNDSFEVVVPKVKLSPICRRKEHCRSGSLIVEGKLESPKPLKQSNSRVMEFGLFSIAPMQGVKNIDGGNQKIISDALENKPTDKFELDVKLKEQEIRRKIFKNREKLQKPHKFYSNTNQLNRH